MLWLYGAIIGRSFLVDNHTNQALVYTPAS